MITIVDTGGANIGCLHYAFERLGIASRLSGDPEVVSKAHKVLLPGVCSAKTVMDNLIKKNLVSVIQNLKVPVLGICAGHQVLFQASDEENTQCLQVLEGHVNQFQVEENCPVPQMGWNQLSIIGNSPILRGLHSGDYVFYANSFYAPVTRETLASSDYSKPFSAIAQKDNFFGAQFHPEKSQIVGERFLKNFSEL